MPKVIVVLPTYNEAENLPLMVDELLALPHEDLHVLVVDDNSPDGTGRIADELAAANPDYVNVLHRAAKQGLGMAYIDGFKRALELDADYIIQMDCDFSHQPCYIPALIAAATDADMVIGSRYVKGGGVDESWSIVRKGLSYFANRIYVRTLLHIPSNDSTGGFRLWKRNTIIGLDLDRVRSNGYVFQVELTYITHRLGFKIVEVPIYFPDRLHGDSKMGMHVASEAALRTWQIMFRYHSLTPSMRRTEAYS